VIRDIYRAILYCCRWSLVAGRWSLGPPHRVCQPVPQVTFDDVTIVVRREFAEEQFGVVMTVLNEYGIETWERERCGYSWPP
jgi:hypothetical protein